MRESARLALMATVCLLAFGGHVRAQDTTPEATPLPSLAEQVGFDDSKLEGLEAQQFVWLSDSATFNTYSHTYRLLDVWESPIGFDEFGPTGRGVTMLYQVDGLKPVLLWSDDSGSEWFLGHLPFISSTNCLGANCNIPAPGDWDGDGTVEFAVRRWASGPEWDADLYYVYQLLPDNRVISSLAGVIPPGYIVAYFEHPFGGGITLVASEASGYMAMGMSGCCGPDVVRYFEFQNGKLVEAWAKHIEGYCSDIGGAVSQLTTRHVGQELGIPSNIFAFYLFNLLQTYEVIHQKNAGWLLAQDLVAQAKREGRLPEGTYVDTVFMPEMKKLYDAGKPFVPPNYVGPKAVPLPDYYMDWQITRGSEPWLSGQLVS